jgi:hypothetical protein
MSYRWANHEQVSRCPPPPPGGGGRVGGKKKIFCHFTYFFGFDFIPFFTQKEPQSVNFWKKAQKSRRHKQQQHKIG